MSVELYVACAAVIGGVACVAFAVLTITSAVNSRAEDKYWAEFWLETPSTAVPVGVIAESAEDIVLPESRQKAA